MSVSARLKGADILSIALIIEHRNLIRAVTYQHPSLCFASQAVNRSDSAWTESPATREEKSAEQGIGVGWKAVR